MDTPIEEQKQFQNVTSRVAASESEITEPNILSIDLLNHVSLLFQFRALGAGYISHDFSLDLLYSNIWS